jgi:hypothetical protein
MRLVLALPFSLSTTWIQHGSDQIAMRSNPSAVIVTSPLLPQPDDIAAWVHEVQHAHRPAGATITDEALVERETATKWRFRIATARIFLGEQVTAIRIGAIYSFFEHVASAVITLPALDDRELAARVEELIEILATARPDFSSQIASIHQLWR